jgi:hypothetical protein
MKSAVLLLVMLVAAAAAQQPGEAPAMPPLEQQVTPSPPPPKVPPTAVVAQSKAERQEKADFSDINCSGFLTRQPLNRRNLVAGGWDTPHTTKFHERNLIYLEGSGYEEGQMVRLARELRDPDEYKIFREQRELVEKTGQPYADLGFARIIALRGRVAVARIEFACREVIPGDIAFPYVERPTVTYMARAIFDRFPLPTGKARGRIVMSEDFYALVSRPGKVYLNMGSDKGIKPGDMFRVLRGYDPEQLDPADAVSFKATTTDDTQKNIFQPTKPKKRMNALPERALGELVVLNVTPSSATAMVTFSLEDVHVGDTVELE